MSLYFKYLKQNFKKDLQYKASFTMSFIAQFFVFFGYYFVILCLFDKFNNIKGFTIYEVLLTFSIIQFGHAFCDTFFRGIDQFDDLIIEGSFDRILLRPRNILLQVSGDQISFIKLSRLLQAIIVFIIAIINLKIKYDILKIITLGFMLLGGVLVFLSIFILAAAYCFLTVKGLEVRNVFTDGGKHMAQYPVSIFKKGFIIIFTFIIPFAFVNYYPLLYVLGRSNNHLLVISPLITIIYLIPSIFIFYKGVKRYSSVGS